MLYWGPIMDKTESMAGEFAQFVLQMQQRLTGRELAQPLAQLFARLFADMYRQMQNAQVCLELSQWLACHDEGIALSQLKRCLLETAVVGDNHRDDTLFVLDESHRLYMQRYIFYEKMIAERLRGLSAVHEALSPMQQAYLQQIDVSDPNKALAICMAMQEALTVISGGPGTGKTWTVLRILQGLLIQKRQLRIALAAPTGKAAARMMESIRNGIEQVPEQSIRERIPVQAQTIHRLLNQSHPLPYDVIVVDEAGMVSLSLMAQLMQAMRPQCRLILLGDKNQLASVEEGAVFAELSERFEFSVRAVERYEKAGIDRAILMPSQGRRPRVDMTDHTVWLTHSHRYDPNGAIAQLAESVRLGKAHQGWSILKNDTSGSVSVIELAEKEPSLKPYLPAIAERFTAYVQAFNAYRNHPDGQLKPLFDAIKKQVVLCCTNEGAFGIDAINRYVRSQCFGNEQIAYSEHFEGEVIMVTVNDHELGLANGDVGIVLAQGSTHAVYFESLDENGQLFYRSVPLGRLPESKRAFAMTVHKSQGSEFTDVLMILPPFSRVLTRELIYTGLTRAKTSVCVLAQAGTFVEAVNNKTERLSGLLYR